MVNKREVGAAYERLALSYVQERGASLVETNFRCRQGEVDLILRDGKYLVFAEVKYRTGSRYGTAAEAVDARKQRTICRVADFYLCYRKFPDGQPVRFDVIALDAPEDGPTAIRWMRDAFPYRPARGRY